MQNLVLEGKIRIYWGKPKVGGQKLRKLVRFEEAVDASDAIRGELS